MKSLALLSAFAALVISAPTGPSKQLARRDPPLSDGVSVLDTINQFRSAYGLPTLSWNDQVPTVKSLPMLLSDMYLPSSRPTQPRPALTMAVSTKFMNSTRLP